MKKSSYMKMLCAILCVMMMPWMLLSCGSDEGESGDKTLDGALTVETLSQYQIVVEEKQFKEFSNVAAALQKNIQDAIGAELKIKSDFVVAGSADYCEAEYEILLGHADREVVTEFYKSIRDKDCGYAMIGTKVIIIGETAEVIQRSLRLFEQDVLSQAAEGVALLRPGESRLDAGSYNQMNMKIDGVDIYEYSI